jgi:hypothetical protein
MESPRNLKFHKYFLLTTDVDIEYDRENYKRSKNTQPHPPICIQFCNILLKLLKDPPPVNLK